MFNTRYYFTFGNNKDMPFQDGWVEVVADSESQAIKVFCCKFPKKNGLVNCAGIYDETSFKRTKMYENGNFGKRCHMEIGLRITGVKLVDKENKNEN